jgi:hypothetical protein
MMAIDDPEPGAVYLIEVTYHDGAKLLRLARFQGFERGMAMWATPPDDDRKGIPASVEIVRQIPLDDRP